MACFLCCYGRPQPQNLMPTANRPQSAEQFADPDARPRQPLSVLSSLQQNYNPQAERIVGCPFRARRLHPASDGPGLPPPDRARIPQDHRVRRRHSLQLRISTSRSLCPHLPGAVRSRRPPPPLGRSARLPGPSHQLQSAPLFRGPQTGGGAGPGRGRSARKVSASGTSSSPRASESLHNFVSAASKSALLSARAHTHIYTHSHTLTHAHTSTHPLTDIAHRMGLKTSAGSVISWGSAVKLTLLNFLRLLLKFPFYLFFPSQCLPPTPTSRTNLWNPCRVPPVTHNACSSHGQHRRPPKVLMFGGPLC